MYATGGYLAIVSAIALVSLLVAACCGLSDRATDTYDRHFTRCGPPAAAGAKDADSDTVQLVELRPATATP